MVSEAGKYRKTDVVDAIQWTGDNYDEVQRFAQLDLRRSGEALVFGYEVAPRGWYLIRDADGALSRPEVDDRSLPAENFAPLQERFGFTVDAAAAEHNAKLPRFWTKEQDGLSQDWAGERVYCNPPYSSIAPWIEKAHTGGADLVVMLLPANRTEQVFWQELIEPYRRAGDLAVEFLPGRLRFLKPGQERIGANERPPFGCCLVIWTAKQTNRIISGQGSLLATTEEEAV